MYRNIHINRHGAAAARGAHNSEVIRSKRIAGILVLAKLIAWCRQLTGVAQRTRAGLITPRSLVQTQSPVSVHIEFIALYGHSKTQVKLWKAGVKLAPEYNKPLPWRA